jgi:hypothetical protein
MYDKPPVALQFAVVDTENVQHCEASRDLQDEINTQMKSIHPNNWSKAAITMMSTNTIVWPMTARVGILFSCYIESDSEPFYVIDYVLIPCGSEIIIAEMALIRKVAIISALIFSPIYSKI